MLQYFHQGPVFDEEDGMKNCNNNENEVINRNSSILQKRGSLCSYENYSLKSTHSTEPPSPAPAHRGMITAASINSFMDVDTYYNLPTVLPESNKNYLECDRRYPYSGYENGSHATKFNSLNVRKKRNKRFTSNRLYSSKEDISNRSERFFCELPNNKKYNQTVNNGTENRQFQIFMDSLRDIGYDAPVLIENKLNSNLYSKSKNEATDNVFENTSNKNYLVQDPMNNNYFNKATTKSNFDKLGTKNRNLYRCGSYSELKKYSDNVFSDDMNGLTIRKLEQPGNNARINALLDAIVPISLDMNQRESQV